MERTSTMPHFSARFRDSQMKLARTIYLKVLVGGSLAIIIAMFCVFSIYWGALWKTPDHNLTGIIIDFDNSTIGSTVSQALIASSTSTKITWKQVDASLYPSAEYIGNRIREEDAWVAVVINYNATGALNAAMQIADSTYNGSLAVTAYGAEARNENAYRVIIAPTTKAILSAVGYELALENLKSITSSSSLDTIATNSPQILLSPVGFTLVNEAPFDQPVATAMTFVGLIYLLILSFFIVMMGLSAREVSGLDRHLTTSSLIKLRVISTFIAYFFISLFYSLLSRAFQVDFSRKFGSGGFVVFWMLNWFGMLSVGLALEAMITIMTAKGVPFFMIVLVISNVSVCALPIEILPHIFRYGYAFPFYNVSRAVRTILFGTKNELGLNFGILLAWTGISCVTLPLFVCITRRSKIKSEEREDGGVFTEDKRVADSPSPSL